jgi:hypothetical protein
MKCDGEKKQSLMSLPTLQLLLLRSRPEFKKIAGCWIAREKKQIYGITGAITCKAKNRNSILDLTCKLE